MLLLMITVVSFLMNCSKKKDTYYCPMHPNYTSDRPGTCPICNMDLVKKEDIKETDHTEHNSEPSSQMEEGQETSDEVVLSKEKQQTIGIKTEIASKKDLTKQFRLYSSVAYDPDLYAALTEYKEAIRSSALAPEVSSGINITNLQLRLRQLGLSVEQIRLWSSGQRDPSELILGGKAGRAHIYSQIYESDLSSIKVGLAIAFKTDVYPNREFRGKIKSIDTIFDKNSRTLRLRSEVSDPEHLLKPQMFGETNAQLSSVAILSIPTSAILDTGIRKLVYVQTGPDRFRPVEVKTGKVFDSWTEIISGVEDGQSVVSESTFLIDSEAKIRFGSNAHSH
ncbi:efflux RND transporter periplasmic adaptor subunit [Leptospira idonii]|nr:efflux RND transporter periplasmic adaptor subunit [Leptospira idonii]